MTALITGASSGIGKDMAKYLASLGWNLIITARREEKLKELKNWILKKYPNVTVKCIKNDVSTEEGCYNLYNEVKNDNIDMFVNNAGFGIFGKFDETSLKDELSLINTNIKAVHILTKLFLKDFKEKNRGYILNVASIAGFLYGPLLSSYYASKSYVVSLSMAINEELRRDKSNVSISVLCPGPTKTEFTDVANVTFNMALLPSKKVAEYGIDKTLKKKLLIFPGFVNKLIKFFIRFIPSKTISKITYNMQKRKSSNKDH